MIVLIPYIYQFSKPFLEKKMSIFEENGAFKYSVQQQVHFNGNVFVNKCCRCNKGSLTSSEKHWVIKLK